jgi:hypothetical protein
VLTPTNTPRVRRDDVTVSGRQQTWGMMSKAKVKSTSTIGHSYDRFHEICSKDSKMKS